MLAHFIFRNDDNCLKKSRSLLELYTEKYTDEMWWFIS